MNDVHDQTGSNVEPPESIKQASHGCNNLKIELVQLTSLKFPKRILRKDLDARIEIEKRFIEHEGQVLPIVVDGGGNILAGEERAEAARRQGREHVSVVRVSGISKATRKKLRVMEAKLAITGDLDRGNLRLEFLDILEIEGFNYDFGNLGFGTTETDLIIELGGEDNKNQANPTDEEQPEVPKHTVSRIGDVWICNRHRIVCGDATDPKTYKRLLKRKKAKLSIPDAPYGVKIKGHVSGNGKIKHREFVQGSDNTSEKGLNKLLKKAIRNLRDFSEDGALIYAWMDWRSIALLLAVGRKLGLTLINLAVWTKTSPAMGSFYRSQHELCAVFRVGTKSHQNNIELGKHGRSRSNVWTAPGMNSFGKDRMELLSSHPTPKNVVLIEEIIKDCTSRGDLVLDNFLGSGTTLIAAEKTGRRCRGIELDPAYVDVAVRRFQKRFGKDMIHEASGLTFDEVEKQRLIEANVPRSTGRIRTRKSLKPSNSHSKGA